MGSIEAPALDDLGKLEITHNLGLDWYVQPKTIAANSTAV
tara:strand:- start:3661 stop:3780 length:120 start_codon:yes stop_codon:yes gene_type:complete